MVFLFVLVLCLPWTLLVIKRCQEESTSLNFYKGHWLGDYVGGAIVGSVLAFVGLWIVIEIQSYFAVARLLLFLIIVANLAIGSWLTVIWLDSVINKAKKGEKEDRFFFVRNSFAAFIFWAATLYWLSAVVLPGVFTPADAYVIKYTTDDLILMAAEFVIGMIVLGFFALLFFWSLSDW